MIKHFGVLVMWLFVTPNARAQEGFAQWVATWGAANQQPLFSDAPVIQNQTVRQIVKLSLGGSALRVRLSNALGKTPLKIDSASVAVRVDGASVAPETLHRLRFGGARSIVIPPAAEVVSDVVALRVDDQAELAISMFLPEASPATTQLTQSHQTSFVSGAGDYTTKPTLDGARAITSWCWLGGVDVRRPGAATIVAFGDSITEGHGSTTDANARWPDVLARRLIAAGRDLAVVDEGIGGNRVLNDEIGPNALARLDRELLTQPGAQYAIVLEGINDIGFPIGGKGFLPPSVALTEVSAEEIIAGLKQIVSRAHTAGITVYLGTLLAFGGSSYANAATRAKQQAVNAWIRSGHAADGMIDFEAATRDPAAPTQLLAAFDSGDHLHPNDAGYAAMAAVIDLASFRVRRPHHAGTD